MTDFGSAFIHGSSSTGRFQGSMDAESSRRMLRSKKADEEEEQRNAENRWDERRNKS